jgi:hypothetical protein
MTDDAWHMARPVLCEAAHNQTQSPVACHVCRISEDRYLEAPATTPSCDLTPYLRQHSLPMNRSW